MTFRHEVTVRLFDTDAAGCLFFGALFRLAHEAFEEFAAHAGFPVGALVRDGRTLFPVVHAEADYAAALGVGDRLSVGVAASRVGDRSFALRYRFLRADGTLAATVELVHAVVDAATRCAVPLPAALRAALEPHRE